MIEKLSKAMDLIANTKTKKKGRNTFSKYDYFTPDQITKLVHDACNEVGLVLKFDLIRNDLGVEGKLTVLDFDGKELVFTMASAIPEIKATNIAQQLGGAMTYTKRYLLMNAFEITDNSLDFDAQHPPKRERLTTEHKRFKDGVKAVKDKKITQEKALDFLVKSFELTEVVETEFIKQTK